MTTSHADHARALRIIQEEIGASEEEARAVLARLNACGIYLYSTDPSPEPYTGEKAAPRKDLLESTRAEIAKAQEAARRAEREHTPTAIQPEETP